MRTKNLALPAAALGALLAVAGANMKPASRADAAADATRAAVAEALAQNADRDAAARQVASLDAKLDRSRQALYGCSRAWPEYAGIEAEIRALEQARANAAADAARPAATVSAAAPAAEKPLASLSAEELSLMTNVGLALALAGGAAYALASLGGLSGKMRRLSVASLDAVSRQGKRGGRAMNALAPHVKAAALGAVVTLAAVTAKTARFALAAAPASRDEQYSVAEGALPTPSRASAPSDALEPIVRGDDYATFARETAAGSALLNARWAASEKDAEDAVASLGSTEFDDLPQALAALPDDGPAGPGARADQRKVETVRVANPDGLPADRKNAETVRVAAAPADAPAPAQGARELYVAEFTGVGRSGSPFHAAVMRRAIDERDADAARAAWSAERKAYLETRSASVPVDYEDALSSPVEPRAVAAASPRANYVRDALLTLRPGESLRLPVADGASVAREEGGSFSLTRTVRKARKYRALPTLGDAVDAVVKAYGAELDAVAASVVSKNAPERSVSAAAESVSRRALRALGFAGAKPARAAQARKAA